MPIQFPDFQRISFNEANPGLVGAERGQALMQNYMQFPQELQAKMLANQIAQVQAQYAEPMAKEGLTAAQQQNLWNPRIWGSEIGLRGAQAGLAGQEAQWYGPKAQAEIALQKAQARGQGNEADMNQLKLNYLRQMLGGQGQQSQQVGQPGSAPQGAPATVQGNAGVGTSAPASTGQAPQQNQPVQQPQQPVNQAYGIETPSPTKEDIANKMLLGMDTFTPRRENARAQQQDQYKKYQEAVGQAVQEANSATNLKQLIGSFNNYMDKSTYTGPRLGSLPSSGFGSAFVPGNLSPEQGADRVAMNMLPAAVEQLRDAMGSARFSNLDMNLSGKMKFDRTMTDEVRANQTAWLNGVQDRFNEKSKFYSYMGNPQTQAQKTQADQLWAAYQNDFPLISKDGKTFQGSNLGNWPLYTTPKAIASIQSTGSYSPSSSERNVFMMQVPDGRGGYQIMPIKKGKVESAFRKGAKPL